MVQKKYSSQCPGQPIFWSNLLQRVHIAIQGHRWGRRAAVLKSRGNTSITLPRRLREILTNVPKDFGARKSSWKMDGGGNNGWLIIWMMPFFPRISDLITELKKLIRTLGINLLLETRTRNASLSNASSGIVRFVANVVFWTSCAASMPWGRMW